MTMTFPTENQNQPTSNNEFISQDNQTGNNDTSSEENTNTVEAFEKTTKGIENPMLVKPMVRRRTKGLNVQFVVSEMATQGYKQGGNRPNGE